MLVITIHSALLICNLEINWLICTDAITKIQQETYKKHLHLIKKSQVSKLTKKAGELKGRNSKVPVS